MHYDEFVAAVADRGGLDEQEAGKASEATLRTLAERITKGSDLADGLPEELRPSLTAASAVAEPFDADEFSRRVSERAGVDLPEATDRARAVLATVREAVPEEFAAAVGQLPDEYGPLLDAP